MMTKGVREDGGSIIGTYVASICSDNHEEEDHKQSKRFIQVWARLFFPRGAQGFSFFKVWASLARPYSKHNDRNAMDTPQHSA